MRTVAIITVSLMSISTAFGGWTAPVRISSNSMYGTSIVAKGNFVHLMSANYANSFVEYFRSTDNGQTWLTNPQFTDILRGCQYPPRLAIRDSIVCAIWDHGSYMFLAKSTNNGQTWRLKNNILGLEYDDLLGFSPGLIDYRPYIMCNRMLPHEDGIVINFNAENIGDTTWQVPVEIMPVYMAGDISTAYNNNVIHSLFWGTNNFIYANMQAIYLRSTNYGQTWSEPINLGSDSLGEAWTPKLVISERGDLFACYMDTRLSHQYDSSAIIYRTSGDNGLTWSDEVLLTASNLVSEISVGWSGNTIAIAYLTQTAERDPADMYCLISSDNGVTWQPEYRLTDDSAYTRHPGVTVSNDTVYAVFCSVSQPGVIDRGLYFMRYDPEPGGISDRNEIPRNAGIKVSSYPNPFNSECLIKFTISNPANVRIEIFDILGQRMATLINEGKAAGEYSILFKPIQLSAGLYFYRVIAGDFSETSSMLLIK